MDSGKMKIIEAFWGYSFSMLIILPIIYWAFDPSKTMMQILLNHWHYFTGAIICLIAFVALDKFEMNKNRDKNEY